MCFAIAAWWIMLDPAENSEEVEAERNKYELLVELKLLEMTFRN